MEYYSLDSVLTDYQFVGVLSFFVSLTKIARGNCSTFTPEYIAERNATSNNPVIAIDPVDFDYSHVSHRNYPTSELDGAAELTKKLIKRNQLLRQTGEYKDLGEINVEEEEEEEEAEA